MMVGAAAVEIFSGAVAMSTRRGISVIEVNTAWSRWRNLCNVIGSRHVENPREASSEELRELYQSVILDHNKKPRNFGALSEASRQVLPRSSER